MYKIRMIVIHIQMRQLYRQRRRKEVLTLFRIKRWKMCKLRQNFLKFECHQILLVHAIYHWTIDAFYQLQQIWVIIQQDLENCRNVQKFLYFEYCVTCIWHSMNRSLLHGWGNIIVVWRHRKSMISIEQDKEIPVVIAYKSG